MKIYSNSFCEGGTIPAAFAMGQPVGAGFGFAGNRNPHLAWTAPPAGTRSLALVAIDPDVPTVAAMVGAPGVLIPIEQPRTEFVHWLMIDLPPDCREIAAGACSEGVTPRGKREPSGPAGSRQGLNDYTAWFAGDAEMAGDYLGYDGPFPPPNDLRLHHYHFRLFALDLPQLAVPARFDLAAVRAAISGHVLAEAETVGTYSLRPGPVDR